MAMKESGIVRLAFVVGDGNYSSAETVLGRLVSVVLFDSGGSALSLFDIRSALMNDYDLEFDTSEIEAVLSNSRLSVSVDIIREGDGSKLYSLTPKACEKLKQKDSKYSIDIICGNYIREAEQDISLDVLKSLLTRFLYDTFNRNKESILALMGSGNSWCGYELEYSEEEKQVINSFLAWDNEDKDKFVFNTVSYCVEYCLLGAKKSINSFAQVLKGKQFYLDTNVLLRLIGFNNEERRAVLEAFVAKCKESGIELCYTNHSYEEAKATIRSAIEQIKADNLGCKPVKQKHYETFSSVDRNAAFYSMYREWSSIPSNRYDDYRAFEKYVDQKLRTVLAEVRYVTFADYETTQQETFSGLASNLEEYKRKAGRPYVNHNSINVDVNNCMYVLEQRNKEKGESLYSLKNYFVSTDSRLCEWSKEVFPGIPLCVLPSVWYSILLKLKGRAKDDYRAFSLFLNMRYRLPSAAGGFKKEQVLSIVQSLDESTSIKEKILDEIADRLDSLTSDDEPVEVVKLAQDNVYKQELARIEKEAGLRVEEATLRSCEKLANAEVQKKKNRDKKILSCEIGVRIFLGIVALGSIVWSICLFSAGEKDLASYIPSACGLLFSSVSEYIVGPLMQILKDRDYDAMAAKRRDEMIAEIVNQED